MKSTSCISPKTTPYDPEHKTSVHSTFEHNTKKEGEIAIKYIFVRVSAILYVLKKLRSEENCISRTLAFALVELAGHTKNKKRVPEQLEIGGNFACLYVKAACFQRMQCYARNVISRIINLQFRCLCISLFDDIERDEVVV